MAGSSATAHVVLLLLPFLFFTAAFAEAKNEYKLVQSSGLAPAKVRREKLSHLRFFWHDIVSGRHPTSVPVASAATTNASATAFGQVNMIDDPLTAGPDMTSPLVGRAQGLYASASQETLGLMMAMNFAFVVGKYNGSTVTVLGRNAVMSSVREMPVIGGSGLFRLARGYAQARTHWVDFNTRDAVVEYNVFVTHY